MVFVVVIRELKLKKKYHFVWLKYVTGFNLKQHCAKCLLGEYEKRITRDVLEYADVELPPSDYYYFCTVGRYVDNIHLAFVAAPGERIDIDTRYFRAVIENARRIEFDDSRIDQNLPEAGRKEFYTCRNWQFANWIINA